MNKKNNNQKETITIGGEEIPIKRMQLNQAELKFYPENPRIYSIVYTGDETPDQVEIEEKLIVQDHVKQLLQSIKANGGLIEPLIVRDGDFVVLEGNSRLAAYRLLTKHDPIKWGMVKCSVIPSDICDDKIFLLLGKYHIIGRKDWAPYEQAGYLWRRNKKQNIEPSTMSSEMGLSVKAINHLINVYEFMINNKDTNIQRWSYYDEYLKSNKIKNRRENIPELDKLVVKQIKTGKVKKAADIRDKLSKVCHGREKTFKKFLNNIKNLDDCYDELVASGEVNAIYNRVHSFRQFIGDPDIATSIMQLEKQPQDKCLFELRQCNKNIKHILNAFNN